MDFIMFLGLAAGVLTTGSSLPQVLKSWKTKQTKDISLGMFMMLFLGVSLWMIYGFYDNDLPIMIANGVSVILVGSVLAMKFKYG